MNKKIAVIQSCYIPWKGYFDIINMVDEFIIYDDVQYTRRDWRNRNKIKTANGLKWLTIPVNVKGQYLQNINETTVLSSGWVDNHWQNLQFNYIRSPYFKEYKDIIKSIYDECKNEFFLSIINYKFIQVICELLNIRTKISWSSDFDLDACLTKTDRLIAVCQAAKATHYLSGPSAKEYIDVNEFIKHNIQLEYMDYSGYQEYPQLFNKFEHRVTILDLIFNCGEKTINYLKSFRAKSVSY